MIHFLSQASCKDNSVFTVQLQSLNDQGLEEIEEWHRSYVDVQQCVDDLEKYKSENEQISIEVSRFM